MREFRRKTIAQRLRAGALLLYIALFASGSVRAQPRQDSTASRSSPSGSTAATGDGMIVAHVNDKPIHKGEVDQALATLLKAQNVSTSSNPKPEHQAAVLEMLIGQRLYADYIARNDDLQATADEVDKVAEDLRRQLREKRRISLEQYVRQLGLTMAGFESQIANDLSRQKLVQKYDTPQWVGSYFKRNARHFDGTQLRVSHILLRPKGNGNAEEVKDLQNKAEQIKAQIESGKLTFADAAKQYSAGPSRQEGGDLGFIGRKGPMVEEFNKAAFDLEQGKISEPVTSTFGVHLITVTEVKPGDKTLELVRDQVMPAFSQWLIEQLIASEKNTAKIEYNENFPHFKPGTRELASGEK